MMKNKTLCCIMLSTALVFTGCTFSESDKATAKKEVEELIADLDKAEAEDTETESLAETEELETEETTEEVDTEEISETEETETPSKNTTDTEQSSGKQNKANTEQSSGTQNKANTEQSSGTQNNTNTEQSSGTQNDTNTEQSSGTQNNTNTEQSSGTQNNTNTEQSSGTQNSTSSEPSSEPEQPAEPQVYVVKTYSEEVTQSAEIYKYGVTRTKITTINYTVYSDGTTTSSEGSSRYTYDASTYSASDDELRAEAESLAATYMGYYQEVLNLVNQIRAEVGVAPLTLDVTLCNAASMRALEMDYANAFSHTRPDGRSCFTAMSYYGISYGAAGENIAAGYGSPAAVVEGWRNSEGHYANMINASFTKLGVGYCNAATEYGWSHNWVQMFSD